MNQKFAGILLTAIAVFSLSFTFGCSRSDGNLVFYDSNGEPIASAQLELPVEIPEVGKTFEGTCMLFWSEKGFPANGMERGRYSANVRDEGIYFDLNSGWADNNVCFDAQFVDGELRGPWRYDTIAGGNDLGSVHLRFQNGS